MPETVYAAELKSGDLIYRAGELVRVSSASFSERGSLVIVRGVRLDNSEFEARFVPGAVVRVERRR